MSAFLEFGLKLIHNTLIHLECLGKNITTYIRLRPENSIRNGDDSRILAAQCSYGNSISCTNIALEVNEPDRKHEHIAFLKGLRDQAIVRIGGDEPDLKRALNECQDLSSSGVGVGRVDSPGCVINTNDGDSQGVEPRQLGYGDRGDPRAVRVRGVARNVQPTEGEVVSSD